MTENNLRACQVSVATKFKSGQELKKHESPPPVLLIVRMRMCVHVCLCVCMCVDSQSDEEQNTRRWAEQRERKRDDINKVQRLSLSV